MLTTPYLAEDRVPRATVELVNVDFITAVAFPVIALIALIAALGISKKGSASVVITVPATREMFDFKSLSYWFPEEKLEALVNYVKSTFFKIMANSLDFIMTGAEEAAVSAIKESTSLFSIFLKF